MQRNLLKLKVELHEDELFICERSQVWKNSIVSLIESDSLNKTLLGGRDKEIVKVRIDHVIWKQALEMPEKNWVELL